MESYKYNFYKYNISNSQSLNTLQTLKKAILIINKCLNIIYAIKNNKTL